MLDVTLTVLGAVGLTTVFEILRRAGAWNRTQGLLHLRFREPIALVLTSRSQDRGGPLDASQASLGNMKAATIFSKAVGDTLTHKPISIQLAGALDGPLDGDVVIFGGPGGNVLARDYLAYLAANCPDHPCTYDDTDESNNVIRLGAQLWPYNWSTVARDGTPEHDYALVVVWVNPFAAGRRRGIYCSGFSAYGSVAAARYLCETFLDERLGQLRSSAFRYLVDRLRRREPVGLPPRLAFRKWPCFALALEILYVGDIAYDVRERGLLLLPMPEYPLIVPDRVGAAQDSERPGNPDPTRVA